MHAVNSTPSPPLLFSRASVSPRRDAMSDAARHIEAMYNVVRTAEGKCAAAALNGDGAPPLSTRTKSLDRGRLLYGKRPGKGKFRTVTVGGESGGEGDRWEVSRIVEEMTVATRLATGRAVAWKQSVPEARSVVEQRMPVPMGLADLNALNEAIAKEAVRDPIRMEHRAEDGVDEHGNSIYRVVSVEEGGEDEEVRERKNR